MQFRQLILLSAAISLTSFSLAEEAEVIGPQSTVEQYEAPVVEPDLNKNFIDFPSLIRAPTEQDGTLVLENVTGIEVEFVGTAEVERPGDFVSFRGLAKAAEETAEIYLAIEEKLAIHQNQPLRLGDLRIIQQDVTAAYREAGYPLMSIVIPPQEVTDGYFKIQINEFQLSDVDIIFSDGSGGFTRDASHWSSTRSFERSMQKIMDAPILSQAALDREVKYLNQNPFREVRVVFEPGDELGQSSATLQVSEKKPWSISAGYNNHATEASGEHRYTIGGSFANLPNEAHQLSFNLTLGDDPEEFENYSLSYRIPTRAGHTLSVSANYSDTASSNIPGISSASTTKQYTANYAWPAASGDSWNLNLDASAVLKQFERASLFNEVNVGGAEFDALQILLNSSLNWSEEHASNQFTANLVVSLEGVTGSNTNDNFRRFYNSLAGEAETEHMVLGYARVQQLGPLSARWEGWTLESQFSWQLAHQELAGSDNFAIGGANVFKAYQASEVAGDDGWYTTQTLNAKPWQAPELGGFGKWINNLALSMFVEVGEGRFEDNRQDSLWDYGLGLRAAMFGNLGCNLSLAAAGKATGRIDKGDVQFFVGCNYQY